MSEKEVELSKVLALLYKYKSKLLIISICSSLVFFGLSFLLNDQYTTSSTLKLTNSENDSSSSSPLGSLSRVAGISGLNLGAQNTDAYYAIEMFKSRDFFKHLNIVNPNLLTFLKYPDTFAIGNKENPSKISQSELKIHKDIFLKKFEANYDEDTGFIKIRFTHESPQFAYDFLNLIIQEINDVTKTKDIMKSERALNYLEEKVITSNQIAVKQSVSVLIETQLKKQMLANVDDYYLLTPIDLPFIPEEKSFPSRLLVLIISFFITFFISSSYLVFNNTIRQI